MWAQKKPDVKCTDSTSDRAKGRLGSGLRVKSDTSGAQDLVIDGSVEGLIQLNEGTLTVGQGLNFGIRGTELTPTSNKLFVVMIFLVQGRTGSGDLRGRKADQDGFRIPRAFASLQVSCVLIGQMGF
jgi:hypothetical protein